MPFANFLKELMMLLLIVGYLFLLELIVEYLYLLYVQ